MERATNWYKPIGTNKLPCDAFEKESLPHIALSLGVFHSLLKHGMDVVVGSKMMSFVKMAC